MGARITSVGLGLAFLACVRVADAQLPLPTIDEAAKGIRLASSDPLLNEAEALTKRLERSLADREVHARTLRTDLRDELTRRLSAVDGVETTTIARDRQRLEEIEATLATELRMAEEALGTARAALRNVGRAPPQEQGPPVHFEAMVATEVRHRQLEAAVRTREAVVSRMRPLAELDLSGSQGPRSFSQRLVMATWRVQSAEAELEQARLLDAQVRARRAYLEAGAERARLVVDRGDVELAKESLEEARRSAASERGRLVEARAAVRTQIAGLSAPPPSKRPKEPSIADEARAAERGLWLARLNLIDHQEAQIDSDLRRGRARLLTVSALASRTEVALPPELRVARIEAELARIERHIADLNVERSGLRGRVRVEPRSRAERRQWEPIRATIIEHRQVLEKTHVALEETRGNLERIRIIADLGQRTERFARVTWTRVGLSLLVLLIAFLILRRGLPWIRSAVERAVAAEGPFQLSPAMIVRIDAVAWLVLPVLVVVLSAVLLAWPIWELGLSLIEALRLIDTPLFFIDDRPVSVFSILKLVLTLWLAVVVSRLLREFLAHRVYTRLGWDSGLTNAASTFAHYAVLMFGAFLGLRFVGIGLSSLALFAGVLGIGIGFGLRNITENFISGLIILAERPIKIGDYVEVADTIEGRVNSIRARSTTLLTRDNVSLIIPNSEFVGARVTNWSHGDPKVRVAVQVGVAYGSKTDLVRKLLIEVANNHGQVLKKPKPEVQFRAFGNSSLDIILFAWIDDQARRFRIISDLHFAVDKTFRKHKVEIAFPQMDLHFRTANPRVFDGFHNPPVPEVADTELPTSGLAPASKVSRSPSSSGRPGSGVGNLPG